MTEYSHQTIEYHFGNWPQRYNKDVPDGEEEDVMFEKTWLTIINHFHGDDTPSVPFTKLREPNIRLEEI